MPYKDPERKLKDEGQKLTIPEGVVATAVVRKVRNGFEAKIIAVRKATDRELMSYRKESSTPYDALILATLSWEAWSGDGKPFSRVRRSKHASENSKPAQQG
jgi:hypothetical protein